MSRSGSVIKYWTQVKAIVKHLGVSHGTARIWHKTLYKRLDAMIHAESEEENLIAEEVYMNEVDMMQRYDAYIRSKRRKDN